MTLPRSEPIRVSPFRDEHLERVLTRAGCALRCESVQDYVSHDTLTKILDDTEEHIDWLETRLDLIAKVGIENFVQSAMSEIDD